MIEINDVSKEYKLGNNKVVALSHINKKIKRGEFLGILGQSGSGKTTLSNIIAGLLAPSDGEVIVDGVSIWKLKDKEISNYRNKTLGFVFQSFNLIPGLTALENVMLPLLYSHKKSRERKELAKEALEIVGLKERMNHKPAELSGGQMQRVSIARAIINSPKIIIADEPTGNLDCESADAIIRLLRDINEKGVTVIMVTHNPEYTRYFSDIITMCDGRIKNI